MATDYTIPKAEYRALVDENQKLREFARDMWCMSTFCHGTSDAEIADMYRRMRELGFMDNYGEEVTE